MTLESMARAVDRRVPGITYNKAQRQNLLRLESMLPEDASVLIIGAGNAGRLFQGFQVTTTDIQELPGVDVVCDAQELPFADGSYDAVVAIALLEHVLDPGRVADEIRRVLKPGGLVYSEVPFLQRVHAGAWDFTRFTMLGHRRLFRWFDTVRLEPIAGPASSLAWAAEGFLLALFGRNRPSWLLTQRGARLLLFWLPPFDRFLLRLPGGADAACGTAFLGRLRGGPVSDEEVLGEYRGACPTPS